MSLSHFARGNPHKNTRTKGAATDRETRRVAGMGRGVERRQHVSHILRRRSVGGGECLVAS